MAVVLRAGPELAAAVNVTVPLPVPDAPPVTVSQLVSLLEAVQLHQLPVVTVTVDVPPLLVDDPLDGEIE